MSFEQHCNDYAMFGDPERDHYDYEEAARYDRFDGWGDPDPCADDPPCPTCGYDADCAECEAAKADCEVYEPEFGCSDDPDDSDIPF
jgi:hypothetical protein